MSTADLRNHLAYRSDIDGLRGIAVLLVIAFHFNLPPVSGGYIGVDIFFVISGYLITSLLSDGAPTFAALGHFYGRRITRLMPMFVVFLLVTTVVASLLLLPDDFVVYTRSLYLSLLTQANTYFDEIARGYFAPNAHELPLLHTWSLSIEWHFYFVFPLLFLLARRSLSPAVLRLSLTALVIAFAVVSWRQTGDSQQAYFYTSARMVELLIGGLAAIATVELPAIAGRLLVAGALAALLGLAVFFDSHTAYPGGNAIAVCLLAAAIVRWGAGNALLQSRPLVHVGRISYSAYLWHWPFVAFLTYLQIPISPVLGGVLLAAVLGLAHLSYVGIEAPGRRLRLPLPKLVAYLFVLPAAAAITLFQVTRGYDGFYGRLGDEAARVYAKISPYQDNKQLGCRSGVGDWSAECSFGKVDSATLAYLIGDSHSGHYRRFVEELAIQAGVHVISLSHGECLMLPGASHAYRGAAHDLRCKTAIDTAYERIRQSRPRFVFLAQRWVGYPAVELAKLEGAVELLLAQGTTPVILGPVAEDGRDLKACFYRHIKLRQDYGGECRIAQDNPFVGDGKAAVAALFAAIKARHPGVVVIDPQTVQCADGYCAADIDGAPIYEDMHHINGYGSHALARLYVGRFGNPLSSSPP